MPSPMTLTRTSPTRVLDVKMFDRGIKALHRARARPPPQCDLHRLLSEQMIERRTFVKRDSPVILEVGAHTGWFFRHMLEKQKTFGCKQYIQCDISEDRLNENYREIKDKIPTGMEFVQICCDEEQPGAFELPDRSVDMAVTCLSMHWVNHLEEAYVNIRKVLKRDGFCLSTMFGGNTLYELRSAFTLADMEVEGGVSPHVSPMIDGAGVSGLMLQAGFTLPTVDMDRYVLMYESPFHLMEHLQSMGESACHVQRRPYVPRSTMLAMAAIYKRLYTRDSLVPATFEVFHTIGWSPSPDQPQPLERGSAQMSFATISTSTHKEFAQAMEDASRNPNDPELQKRAEELYVELQEMLQKERTAAGMDEDVAKAENVSPSHKAPAPPGEANVEPIISKRFGK